MKIYQRYEGLSPIYQGYLTNHLPMYYQILKDQHVSQDVIIEKLDSYKEDRDLYSLTDPMYPRSDFEQEYINRTSYYLGEFHKLGQDVVVGAVLNECKDALYGALFHGIIRLSYALQGDEELLVAQALAYLELVAEPIELPSRATTKKQLFTSFEQIKQYRQTIELEEQTTTMEKVQLLLHHNEIAQQLFHLEYADSHRNELLQWWLNDYQSTQSFYTLHVITGFHALLTLEEYMVDFPQVLQQFVVIAQLFMILQSHSTELVCETTLPWDIILEKMIECTDIHHIKLIYSLHELYNLYHLPQCQDIASAIISIL